MSDSRFNLWRDFLLDKEEYNRLNKNSDTVLDIINTSEGNSDGRILESLQRNPQLVIIAVDQIEGSITFFYNIQELLERIGSSFNSRVGLQG